MRRGYSKNLGLTLKIIKVTLTIIGLTLTISIGYSNNKKGLL
jgi:hypothetical protein